MSDFWLYFKLGLNHVLDWAGYDHLLFIVVLCAAYTFSSWKRLLLLVTVFTVGHTTSLFLSNYGIVNVSPTWIEFLIPITILTTAGYNIFRTRRLRSEEKTGLLFFAALFFGIIHGFGFGRYFNQINDEQELMPLIEFALGIETAQIIVVFIVLILASVSQFFVRFKKRDWIMVVSSIVIGMTIPMVIENWPF
jgi:ABC-type transport system involved in multi-copper enzyme maturation permease subunit